MASCCISENINLGVGKGMLNFIFFDFFGIFNI